MICIDDKHFVLGTLGDLAETYMLVCSTSPNLGGELGNLAGTYRLLMYFLKSSKGVD